MKRIFIALWPDTATSAQIAQTTASWAWPADCRRYAAAELHATLHFIGSVKSERLTEIGAALQVPFEPCSLVLDTPHRWPGGLAVLCPRETPDALKVLHARLGEVLHGLALPVSPRPLVPHVTLARRCEGMEVPTTCAPVSWSIDRYALVLSTGDARARYVTLQTYRADPETDV